MEFVFDAHAWEDYFWWQTEDRRLLGRINSILRDIERGSGEGSPHAGIGKRSLHTKVAHVLHWWHVCYRST